MRNRGAKSRDKQRFEFVLVAGLISAAMCVGCCGCPCPETPKEKAPNKLPPPIAHSSADFVESYEGYTVLVDSFDLTKKAEAYYLAGQLRAAQTRSFVLLRPNKKMFVCVGNNKTRRQAESICKYLNNRYELESKVIKSEAKPLLEE